MTMVSLPGQPGAAEEKPRGVPGAAAHLAEMRSGGNWFYWIAGLTLVNSVVAHSGSDVSFSVGLVITMVFDYGAQQGVPMALAVVVDVLAIAGFVLLGVLSARRSGSAFVTGLVIYGLDAVLLLLAVSNLEMLLPAGIHAFLLWRIGLGYRALRRLRALERAVVLRPPGPRQLHGPGSALVAAGAPEMAIPPGHGYYPPPPPGIVMPPTGGAAGSSEARRSPGAPALEAAEAVGSAPPIARSPASPAPPSGNAASRALTAEALGLVARDGWLLEPSAVKDLAFLRDQMPPRPYGVLQHLWGDLRSWPDCGIWLLGLGLTGYGVLRLSQGAVASSLWSLVPGVFVLGFIARLARNAIHAIRHGVLREVPVTMSNLVEVGEGQRAQSFATLRFPLEGSAPDLRYKGVCRPWARTLLEHHGAVTLLVLATSRAGLVTIFGARPLSPE